MPELKIHPPIIAAVISCLKAVFEENKVADKEVSKLLKENKNFGSRDRSMLAESVYDVVRWKLKYTHQLSLYNAALSKYAHLIFVSLLNRGYTIKNPEALGMSADDVAALQEIISAQIDIPFIEQSYPESLYQFCLNSIGASWPRLAVTLNQRPDVFIRVNTLKTTKQKFKALLEKENIEFKELNNVDLVTTHDENKNHISFENSLQLLSKNNLKNSALYKDGLLEFQDIGSQSIGKFVLDAVDDKSKLSELKLLDLCAGAGGKTLHLSALLNNKGKIYATDYKAYRLKNLKQRAAQAGCENIEIIDFNDVKQYSPFDIILIDAPCSGTGTFKRQPDLKYKITTEKIEEYQNVQESLLKEYKKLLSNQGKIVYATCSVLPEENELQIEKFIKNNPGFKLESYLKLQPSIVNASDLLKEKKSIYTGDGFYMALLSKQ